MFSGTENNINWLAQCKKKVDYPVDRSDRAGLTAFEYGWKSFNNLYSEFKVGPDREKMRACLDKYIVAQDFINANKKSLVGFCDIHHRIYMTDAQYEGLNPKLSSQVQRLKESIAAGDHSGVMTHLLDCLYTVRNARIHGSFGTGKVRFSFLPRVIYKINVAILASKLSTSEEVLEAAIDEEVALQKIERKQGYAC